MATSRFVEVSKKPQPKFKRYPMKSVEDDPLGAFSYIPYGILPTKDIREYIHGKMEKKNSWKV